jgi:hyperosmotically inducible periplasmic protein
LRHDDARRKWGVVPSLQETNTHGEIMKTTFAAILVLAGAFLGPIAASAADSSTDTTGQYMDDAAITAKVKASFAGDKWVKGRDISVRTDHGVVDLTGTVDSKDESDRATELATQVKSVTAVHNNLTVTTR